MLTGTEKLLHLSKVPQCLCKRFNIMETSGSTLFFMSVYRRFTIVLYHTNPTRWAKEHSQFQVQDGTEELYLCYQVKQLLTGL